MYYVWLLLFPVSVIWFVTLFLLGSYILACMHKAIQSDFKNSMSYRPKSKHARGQHLVTRIKTTGMATHGSVSAFEQSKEDWTSYVEHLDFYFAANDVTTDLNKRAILLSVCGASTYKLIRSLLMHVKAWARPYARARTKVYGENWLIHGGVAIWLTGTSSRNE